MQDLLFLGQYQFFGDKNTRFVNILQLGIFKINPTFAMQ